MPVMTNVHLADRLFCLPDSLRSPPKPARTIRQAAGNAQRRWPELAGMVEAAVRLVESGSLYEMPGEPNVPALCRIPGSWKGRLISLTATGLRCTCPEWPPAVPTGPGDQLYCPDILGTLLHVYLRRPLLPLPHSPESLWREALAELRHQMTRATFTNLLAGTRPLPDASTPLLLTIATPSPYAEEWLTHRLQPVIRRTLAGIAGYPLNVRFVATTMRSNKPQSKESIP